MQPIASETEVPSGFGSMRGMGTLGLALLMVASACDLDGGPRDPGLHGELDGALLPTRSTVYGPVFALARPDRVNVGLSLCSATLIAPTVLLTAAHCVTIEPGDGSYEIQDPSEFFVTAGEEVASLSEDVAVEAIEVHPEYIAGTAHRDLAVVLLADDATALAGGFVMPVARYMEAGHLDLERGVDIVGHGGTDFPEPYGAREQSGVGSRMHLPHVLDDFGCSSPDDPACESRELVLTWDNSPEAGFCGGGDGGALLVFRDAEGNPTQAPWQYLESSSPIPPGGSVALAGVVSRVDAGEDGCTGEGIAARVDTAMAFIERFLDAPSG